MIRSLTAIFMIVFLGGCSGILHPSVVHDQMLPPGRSLWRLTIGDQDKPEYTGLLALRDSGDMLDLVLLDSTGIKLLSQRIYPDGEIEIQSAVPLVKEKGLPAFLGKGLSRIFQHDEKNAAQPCYRDVLVKKCFGEDSKGRLVKSGHIGPFKLWSAEYFINKDKKGREHLSDVTLDRGWFVPALRLESIENDA